MLTTPSETFRWTDPSSWSWFFKLWLAIVLVSWLVPLWRWFRREQQKSWPTASGTIDSAHIGEPKRFLGLTLPTSNDGKYTAVLAYSYTLSGSTFRGEYRSALPSEADAHEFLRDLQGQNVPVQYAPNNAARSVLLAETVEALIRNRAPLPNEPSWMSPLPAWSQPLIRIAMFLALAGLLLSAWVHVNALLGHEPQSLFWGLHGGVFVVFVPALVVGQRRVGSTARKDFWKAVTKGSPDGVRYLLYVLLAYAFIGGIVGAIQAPPGVNAHQGGPEQWRSFSSIWMVFYYASFAILSSALGTFSDGSAPSQSRN